MHNVYVGWLSFCCVLQISKWRIPLINHIPHSIAWAEWKRQSYSLCSSIFVCSSSCCVCLFVCSLLSPPIFNLIFISNCTILYYGNVFAVNGQWRIDPISCCIQHPNQHTHTHTSMIRNTITAFAWTRFSLRTKWKHFLNVDAPLKFIVELLHFCLFVCLSFKMQCTSGKEAKKERNDFDIHAVYLIISISFFTSAFSLSHSLFYLHFSNSSKYKWIT